MSSSIHSPDQTSSESSNITEGKCPSESERRNAEMILCDHCNSIILRVGDSIWMEGNEREIPLAIQREGGDLIETERLQGWWTAKDKFAFESVGVTNSVDGIRYLTCGDCDFGPIGIAEDKLHIVAHSRVKMESVPSPTNS
ncbi:hypothetical protein PENTCL1PPCAC_1110 [Pristionchus entomophagus]|uniref:Uncharacterized protein n=1 Tax=Pristionchus entomophagus TaxID=358040 RepID=A0AAV5S8N9_9BILA|nr:hypothetical protein PENTCL1PPCAC_1110 [Pristionchus entomophagus]